MKREKVVLQHVESGEVVEADLIDRIDPLLAKRAEDAWQTYLAAAKATALTAGVSFPRLEHEHWRWEAKVKLTQNLLSYQTMAIECEGEVQGLMMLKTDGHFGRLPSQHDSPLVYVNLLATAPWNLSEVTSPPIYRGAGTILLAAAASLSVDLGFKGRLGLHSLSKSEGWYDRLEISCLGPDSEKQGLKYYEFTPDQADNLIR